MEVVKATIEFVKSTERFVEEIGYQPCAGYLREINSDFNLRS